MASRSTVPCFTFGVALLLACIEASRCPNGIPCSCTSEKLHDPDADNAMVIDCSRRALNSIPFFVGYLDYKINKILLNNNRITNVPSRQFLGLNVSEINLDKNPIIKVEADAFQGAFGLLGITMNGCNLTEVPGVFEYAPDLIDLSINSNKIRNISPGTFSAKAKLHFLDMSHNPLNFHENMFIGLEHSLKDLKLNGMGLRRIPVHALSKLIHLDNLELQDNFFTHLNNETFHGLPKNRYTHYIFDNNFITEIATDTFKDHQMPVYLDFHENRLRNVDFLQNPCFFESSIIHLHGNQIECDCHLYNITKHRHLKIHGKCHGPKKFKNLPIMHEPEVHTAHNTVRSFSTLGSSHCKDKHPTQRYDCPCQSHGLKHDARHHRKHAMEMQCVSYVIDNNHVTQNGACREHLQMAAVLLISLLVVIGQSTIGNGST